MRRSGSRAISTLRVSSNHRCDRTKKRRATPTTRTKPMPATAHRGDRDRVESGAGARTGRSTTVVIWAETVPTLPVAKHVGRRGALVVDGALFTIFRFHELSEPAA